MNKLQLSHTVRTCNAVPKKPKSAFSLIAGLIIAGAFQPAHAALVTTFYGDDDGFGVGATSGTMDPFTSHQNAGEALLTDTSLISTRFSDSCGAGKCGPFNPGGSFDAFTLDSAIISAVLTLRTGSFDSNPALDGQNRIFLDGLLVDSSFIDGFSASNTNNVETRSITLDSSFFPLLSDGNVSLAGTHISEADGSRQFQIDFLRLDITTASANTPAAVPVPAAFWLFGSGLLGMIGISRRKKTVA